MSAEYATFEGKDEKGRTFSVESNTETAEQMAKSFGQTPSEKAPKAPEGDGPDDDGSDGADDAVLPPAAAGEVKKPNPKHDLKARMLDAARKESEAKKERDLIRAQKDEIERRAKSYEEELARLRPKEAPKAPEPAKDDKAGRPKLADFDSIEDHAEAVANWVAEKRDKERSEAAAVKTKEEARVRFLQDHQKRVDSFLDRFEKEKEANPLLSDFKVLKWTPLSQMRDLGQASQVNFIAQQFIDRDKGFDLLMYLESHPQDVERITKLDHPAKIEYALDLIESSLGVATTATMPEDESSKAAPPARPVTGGAPIRDNGPNERDSDDDFIRKANAARLRKLKASA